MAVMQASESNINFVKTRIASPDGKLWGKAPGMVLMKPSSISYSGTSATLGENGQVTFDTITSLSLNGCFTADFDNYVIYWNVVCTGSRTVSSQLLNNGTPETGLNYSNQYLFANDTSVTASRSTSGGGWNFTYAGGEGTGIPTGSTSYIYGPYLSQPTAFRTTAIRSSVGTRIDDRCGTNSLSSSFDGIYFVINVADTMSGSIAIYGVRS